MSTSKKFTDAAHADSCTVRDASINAVELQALGKLTALEQRQQSEVPKLQL